MRKPKIYFIEGLK